MSGRKAKQQVVRCFTLHPPTCPVLPLSPSGTSLYTSEVLLHSQSLSSLTNNHPALTHTKSPPKFCPPGFPFHYHDPYQVASSTEKLIPEIQAVQSTLISCIITPLPHIATVILFRSPAQRSEIAICVIILFGFQLSRRI